MPDLVSEAFRSATGALIRTARHLGVLSWPARAQLVRRCSVLPSFEPGLGGRRSVRSSRRSRAPACRRLWQSSHAPAGTPGRAPALLCGPVERHVERVRRALPTCRLAVLRAAVDVQLSRSVGAKQVDREALSAMALLQDAEKNRRGLRRFLRALLNGEADHLRRHPATQNWARRHPQIDLEPGPVV